jgi:excisionase family DNA binding protein
MAKVVRKTTSIFSVFHSKTLDVPKKTHSHSLLKEISPQERRYLKMAEKLFSVNEAAAQLGIKPKTLYARIQKGGIPAIKLFGWTIRLTQSDIDSLVTYTGGKAVRQ